MLLNFCAIPKNVNYYYLSKSIKISFSLSPSLLSPTVLSVLDVYMKLSSVLNLKLKISSENGNEDPPCHYMCPFLQHNKCC